MEENKYIETEDDFGDIITREDYEKCVIYENFIDYDGYCRAGKHINGVNMFTKERYFPSQLEKMPKDYEFVQWYNR